MGSDHAILLIKRKKYLTTGRNSGLERLFRGQKRPFKSREGRRRHRLRHRPALRPAPVRRHRRAHAHLQPRRGRALQRQPKMNCKMNWTAIFLEPPKAQARACPLVSLSATFSDSNAEIWRPQRANWQE